MGWRSFRGEYERGYGRVHGTGAIYEENYFRHHYF
jgi:hypothetical protein